jgi:hypothetical protein
MNHNDEGRKTFSSLNSLDILRITIRIAENFTLDNRMLITEDMAESMAKAAVNAALLHEKRTLEPDKKIKY